MYAAIMFIVLPFVLLHYAGVKGMIVTCIASVGTILIIAFGFLCGLLACALFEPNSYWQSYQGITLWSDTYDSWIQHGHGGFGAYFAFPYIVLIDAIRGYLHFNFTRGNLFLWIPEGIAYYALFNFYNAYHIAKTGKSW